MCVLVLPCCHSLWFWGGKSGSTDGVSANEEEEGMVGRWKGREQKKWVLTMNKSARSHRSDRDREAIEALVKDV